MNLLQKYINGFISLFYPKLCLVCNSTLLGNEELVCTLCRYSLPETNFHKSPDNPVEQIFWGRVPIERATALLFFEKESPYRKLIHALKYKGRKEVGTHLGKLLGSKLTDSGFSTIDGIIPIPLHKAKLRRRGFNQSEIIAQGIADILDVPLINNALKRKINISSQTRKGRYERWKNVDGIFECINPELVEGKQILLIDDVITTGSTIEAAAIPLSKIPGTKISVATLAYALP